MQLLDEPVRARRIGLAAHTRVRDNFLGPFNLRGHFDLIQRLIANREKVEAHAL